jgi:hypothetical protein
MNDLIQDELSGVLQDWRDGKPIRSIALGHSLRLNKDGQHERHVFRQKAVHDLAFHLIEIGLDPRHKALLDDFAAFRETWVRGPDLSQQEEEAAFSLAWVALHRGWTRAIANHAEHEYISIKREADA